VPNSSALDLAIVTVLSADAQLRALMPDGVYLEAAPPGADQFVKVGLVENVDLDVQGGRAQEEVLYSVVAVGLSRNTNNQTAMQAADRIDALLADPAPFAIEGYTFVSCHRDEPGRIGFETPSDQDPTVRWLNRGAHYRLTAAL
jgi:hypothetical protein